jgi:AcrR family transcriptional regulator
MGRKNNAPHRRGQIVWALYDCLAKEGSEKVTIKKIAAQAGLPPGVIHYYFKSKDEIVSNLAEAMVDKYGEMLGRRLAEAVSAERKIEYTIDFIVNVLIFNRPLNRVFYNLIQLAFERKELGSVLRKMFRDYREQFTQIIVQGGADREDKMMGAALVAVTEGFSIQLMVDPSAFKKADVRRLIAETLRNRLATVKG